MKFEKVLLSKELLNELKLRKINNEDTYEEIIFDLLEDSKELSKETLDDIEQSKKDFNDGKIHTLDEIEKEIGYKNG